MADFFKSDFFYNILVIYLFIFLSACTSSPTHEDPSDKLHSPNSCFATIEIPAGTNKKYDYNESSKALEQDHVKGEKRVINFLPYPGNYGFIPNTLINAESGGEGEALDVLILAESLEKGTKMEILPIGVLLLKDKGKEDSKIIAVPWESKLRVIDAPDFATFITEYQAAQQIIQEWFLNYKGIGSIELLGWRDEKFARAFIKKWSTKNKTK